MLDVRTINGGLAVDDRGSVRFCNDFDMSRVKRFYQVENHDVGFIRAFHGHKHEKKWFWPTKGTFLVGCFSMSTKESCKMIISSESPKALYIPEGHANGAMTLTPGAVLTVFSSSTLEESKGDDIRYPWDELGSDFWNIEYR